MVSRSSALLPKTQIEDSPATDNKLESIVDVPREEEEAENEAVDTDEESISDDLIHDDDHVEEEKSEELPGSLDDHPTSESQGSVIHSSAQNPSTNQPSPSPVIILTGDEILKRLQEAEVINLGPR